MKECPICKARCFEDMEVCYGCLHEFKEGEGNLSVAESSSAVIGVLEQEDPFEPEPGCGCDALAFGAGNASLQEKASAPSDVVPESALGQTHSQAFRLEIPASMKSFTVRCEGIQVEGCMA